MTTRIPDTFLIGGALAACQAEGAWNEGGKSLTVADCAPFTPHIPGEATRTLRLGPAEIDHARTADPHLFPKRRGVDFYHRFEEDLDLLQEMGSTAFRYSFSWARVMPDGDGTINAQALDYYDRLIDAIVERGMAPIMTLSHFDLPVVLIDKYGGWTNRDLIDLYVTYATTLIDRYGDRVKYWVAFNEINMSVKTPEKTLGLLRSEQSTPTEQELFQALHHQFVAAARVGEHIARHGNHVQLGNMIGLFTAYPATSKPEDAWAADEAERMQNSFYLDVLNRGRYPYFAERYFREHDVSLVIADGDLETLAAYPCTFIGASYYTSALQAADPNGLELTSSNVVSAIRNPHLPANAWGWQIDPLGLRWALNTLAHTYEQPVIILENGSGFREVSDGSTIQDDYRVDYVAAHLSAVLDAVADGVQVIGYTAWSVIDTISSSTSEMEKRYGFVYVDQDDQGNGTLNRSKKASFDWFRSVIDSRGSVLDG
ncbi:glycoside hydrolase family 1 protein [Microbacterium sp.]|uniref:glycoside hydrolase family 1 protein n=1 Tax=Microbacterium sp. TaxID=51671 RepID=UPI003C737CB1